MNWEEAMNRLLGYSLMIGFLTVGAAYAQQPVAKRTPIGKATTTEIGQPIEMVSPAEVTTYTVELEVGVFPTHKHPYQRIVYVLEGTLTVEDDDGNKKDFVAGSTLIEMREKWHRPVNKGPGKVKLLVVDIAKPGENNQIQK
jgi:quercetin dioxygenase-like cupin family protein